MSIITLTTDYGLRDHYVAAVKGVLINLAPKAHIIDVTHEIEAHNVAHGAFVLRQTLPWYPKDTVHLVVVDPGVGSARRILLARYAGQYVVAPDNGLITFLQRDLPAEAMLVIENRKYFLPNASSTFHGRDIMAPVAAHLANGVRASEFGRATDRVEMLPIQTRPEVTGRGIIGGVLYVDRFGNLISNIGRAVLATVGPRERPFEVVVNGRSIGPIRTAFYEAAVGEPLAYIGSCDLLEVAVNQGRAVELFGPGERVRVEVR